MKIEVLGSGCPSCHKLFELVKKAAAELGLEESVEYSDEIGKIIEMGVMQMPVLALDGKPVMTGATDDIEKIKSLLTGRDKSEKPETKSGSGCCSCGGRC